MTNDFQTAGRILGAIRRSESAAKSAEVAAWKRHQERCEKPLAGVSPVVRKLIETHREASMPGPAEPLEPPRCDPGPEYYPDDMAGIAPSLLKEPEPMTGVVEKRRA